MVLLHEVRNPFQPVASRVTSEVEWREGLTLADAMDEVGVPAERHTAVIDGLAVPEEMLAGYVVPDGAAVVVMPFTAGGGFGKMFAEIAVMVAAAALTSGFSLAFAGIGIAWTGLAVSSTTASLISGAIAIGGNLLINAFMGGSTSGGASSASFDPAGPKTIASGGTPIPKGYGTFKSGGNVISGFTSAAGLENYENAQVSYGWGPAVSMTDVEVNNNPIGNYTSTTYMVRLGTNDQTVMPGFNRIVNGYSQDTRVIALAGDIGTGANPGTPVVIQGTGTKTQGLEVVIQFPDGVFYSNNDGSLRSLSIAYKVEYSVSGQNNWQVPIIPNTTTDVVTYTNSNQTASYPKWVVIPTDEGAMPNIAGTSGVVYTVDQSGSHNPGDPWTGTQTVTYYNADGSTYQGSITLQGEWQLCDPSLNQVIVESWSGGYIIFTNCNQGTLYNTTAIYNLPPNKYDVRVTKYGSAFAGDAIQPREADNNRTGDQMWVWSINEIQYQDLVYPNIILCGVKALATNQLSGANLQVTALVEYGFGVDTPMPAALAAFGTSNPAAIAFDMLTNPLYGGAVDPSKIDLPAFLEWAAYCNEEVSDGFEGTIPRAAFNGVFDMQGTNLWRSLQKVASLGYANIVQVGMTYSVVMDEAVAAPVQIFNVGNIIRDSIKDTWISLDDRANRIEATFADAARNYRTDEPCAVIYTGSVNTGLEVKPTRVQLLGCTSRAQAWYWSYRKLETTDEALLQRSFDVAIEAVACQIGSVIGVQDDVTNYAQGGRVQAGSTTTFLLLDRTDLTYASGAGYTITVLHPVVERGSATVQSIAGMVVKLAAAAPSGRLQGVTNQNGVQGIVTGVSGSTVTLESTTGFASGDTLAFYDTDVLDTQPVASLAGGVLVPLVPFMQAPEEDCPWVYGQSGGVFPAQLFTVTNIRKSGDFKVTLDTLQYVPPTNPTAALTETIGTPDVSAAVTSLTAQEQYVMANGANGGQSSVVALGWRNGSTTSATQIWVARNEANQPLSAESLVATVSKASTYVLQGVPTGTILQVRAVGVDAAGATAPYSTAPVTTITVQGAGLAPGDITTLSGSTSGGIVSLSWTAPASAATYEVRYNADLNNANWQNAQLLWSGSATSWADTVTRTGLYLVKAVSAAPGSVESINAASYSYLQGVVSGGGNITAASVTAANGLTAAVAVSGGTLHINGGVITGYTASTA